MVPRNQPRREIHHDRDLSHAIDLERGARESLQVKDKSRAPITAVPVIANHAPVLHGMRRRLDMFDAASRSHRATFGEVR